MLAMIRFACPHCRTVLTVPHGSAGRTFRCPRCGNTFKVPVLFQGGTPPIRSSPVVRPEGAFLDAEPNPRMGQTLPSQSAPFSAHETTVGEEGQDEGRLGEQELPYPGMPAGTKAAIFLLSLFVVLLVMAGALLLIRDGARKEAAALQAKEGVAAAPQGGREISRPLFRPPPLPAPDESNAPSRSAEQPQLERGEDGPVPSSPQDPEDASKQGKKLPPKLPPPSTPDPPRENGAAKPEITPDNAEDTRNRESTQRPAKDYELSCEAARTKLLKGFDTVIDALAKTSGSVSERLKWKDIVEQEKARFETRGLIPWSKPMRPYVDGYLASLTAAQKNLRGAYDALIDKELRARNDARVEHLRSELRKRLDIKEMARWRHIVNGKGPGVVFTLHSNGKINDIDGQDLWNYEQGVLIFRRAAPNGPGGIWLERLEVSAEGTTYTGTNNDKPDRRPNLTGVYALDALRPPIVVGKAAPEIEGEDIDGKSFKLSDYRGKVVLLDFWGNW